MPLLDDLTAQLADKHIAAIHALSAHTPRIAQAERLAERIGIDPERVRKDQQREDAATVIVYRHPIDSDTEWNGKGRKPLWVTEWENTGESIEALAVEVPKKPASQKKGAKA